MTIGYKKIVFGIPTIESEFYIYSYLLKICQEIIYTKEKISSFRMILAICINGDDRGISSEILKLKKKYQNELEFVILFEKNKGKNRALNKILNFSRKENAEIIHFLDDDIIIKKGSIAENILELLNFNKVYNSKIVLVGSNFLGIKERFYDFIKNYKFFKGIYLYFLHRILILPFLKIEEQPSFCIGSSLCGFLDEYPDYPDDTTEIADDGFIGNFFLLKGKEKYVEFGINPIIKPKNSIIYFRISKFYKEWLKQQIRIFIGVYYSYLYYKNEMKLFEEYFSWKYSVGKNLRKKTIDFRFSFFLLRIFQKQIYKKSMKIIKNKQKLEWNIAKSTKKYERVNML